MKIMIAYPPIPSDKGVPLISQNRQFQWFNRPTFIYPVVPAYAASLLQARGYEVVWGDGVASMMKVDEFKLLFDKEAPDLIAIEAKTPVIRAYWKWASELKRMRPNTKVVLMGDHVTGFPEEAFEHCDVDYVITGGDFDWALLNLANHLSKGEALEGGVFWKDKNEGVVKNSGTFKLEKDLNDNPFIDRDLTQWQLYAVENGNFKYTPGTYQMAGRDCWWGKCTFCSWTTTFNNFRAVKPERHLDEVEILVKKYGVREIFDDTGTFPAGMWLKKFCEGLIERGLHKKVVYGANMKPGVLKQEQWNLMGKANFRFMLFGVESANQTTTDRLLKGGKVEDIPSTMRMAKKAGLEPHVTCMVGYPWETYDEAKNTIDLCKKMFDEGSINTLQATIVIPYPGTPLHREAREKGWLLTEDYDRYDMREPVMKLMDGVKYEDILTLTQSIYKSFLTPRFVLRKLMEIRNWDDIKFLFMAAGRVIGHLTDFSKKQPARDTTDQMTF
jgi:anaerobic magnesium-protoporphyrin IX monomethyl ester cyclase